MAHDARIGRCIPGLLLLLVIGGCSNGGSDSSNQQSASPPAASPPASPPPASTALQSVIYQTFAAAGDSDLHAVREDGTASTPLATTAQREHFRGISSDGWVVYDRDVSDVETHLVSVPVAGGETRQLDASSSGKLFRGFTPDNRVIYEKSTATGSAIHSVRPDGAAPAALVDEPNTIAQFIDATPDGRVLYQACARSQDPAAPPQCVDTGLYSVAADGTGLRALADTQDFEWFEDVAPDGRVVYMRCIAARGGPCEDPAAQSDLISVRVDGSNTATLAATSAFETYRAVTTGNRVIYQRYVGSQHDIESVRTDGTEPRTLANTPVDERYQGLR